jgi:hypothetical protein
MASRDPVTPEEWRSFFDAEVKMVADALELYTDGLMDRLLQMAMVDPDVSAPNNAELFRMHNLARRAFEHFDASCNTALVQLRVRCGNRARFKLNDRVTVVRLLNDIDPRELVGFTGVVQDVEELAGPQFNYTVSGRYLNEQQLELADATSAISQ